MNTKIRLHHLTFLAFTIISSVPVFFLAIWVQQSALDKEVESVQEKHLLVAENATLALSRYIEDVESVFRMAVANIDQHRQIKGISKLLGKVNFLHICLVAQDGQILDVISGTNRNSPDKIPSTVLKSLQVDFANARQATDKVFFSALIQDAKGQARIFVVKALDDDKMLLGILATTYIQKIQQSITFGERGHAAIVDNLGRVMAHPVPAWQQSMKDISQLKPIKLMMQGNSGVTQFYSPPMQADMIVGYASVAKTGWGVMIPQPFKELQDRAHDVRFMAFTIALFGITVAGVISWFLARYMADPIRAVVQAALNVPQSNQLKLVNYPRQYYLALELQTLISAYNQMVNDIRNSHQVMEETATRLEEVQRIAKLGHWEWDMETDQLWCSREFFRICNISEQDFSGHYQSLLNLIHPDDRELFQNFINKIHHNGELVSIEHRIILPNQELRFVHHEGKPICRKEEPVHLVGIVHDITERKRHEDELFHQANFDQLTGLPNRSLFFNRLSQALNISKRNAEHSAILFIDLDNFKDLNDSYGHIIGDQLLTQAAKRLLRCVHKDDTIARIGGDEFVVILNKISQNEDAAIIAKRILHRLTGPFQIKNLETFISASIGITIFPTDADNNVALMRNADIALYQAKGSGRNTFCFYTKSMEQEVINRTILGNELRHALEQNELQIYYQPIIDLHTGEISSAEALLRWNHRQRGFISPQLFIPIAEETGIIEKLGTWVLKNACREAKKWQAIHPHAPGVSVNLSMQQLKLGLSPQDINDILSDTQLAANKLTLEITESMFMDDLNETIQWMNQVKNLGIDFSVDDFGTGYSSLSYLKRLPINALKIDRAFVIDSTKKSDDAMLVRTIIAIGKSLNLKVVAEGVEEEQQIIYLKRLHCDCVQGYYYSKPIPDEEFIQFLSGWDKNRTHFNKKLVAGSA